VDPDEPFISRPEATALLVIDMQNDFLLPGAPVPAPGGLELVPVIADLVHSSAWNASPDISYMRRISRATPIRSAAGASSTNPPSIRSSFVTR
jgi:nicotinamidase-related amidase